MNNETKPYPTKCPRKEFTKLLLTLNGTDKWTVAERATYFAFFCNGWYGRANEAEYQIVRSEL